MPDLRYFLQKIGEVFSLRVGANQVAGGAAGRTLSQGSFRIFHRRCFVCVFSAFLLKYEAANKCPGSGPQDAGLRIQSCQDTGLLHMRLV